ncbi:Hpt domain-containing protein [Paucidesulfovibrio longus]|uniref:Hpt domain-containing protein n=1 Tax=Paucidesulfovibrio longus TaxID=889 RepID=UPI0003B70EA8|nr:Hpt domain-containing protein [Paucidesulfovibrio longus]
MMSERIAFDAERLMESLDNDEELLEELLRAYVEDAPLRLAALTRGVEEGDAAAVVTAAHSLKGMTGVIRIAALEQKALELEMAGRSGNIAKIREIFPAFRDDLERVLSQAGEYLR